MAISNLVAVVTDHDSVVAVNPDSIVSVGPRSDGSAVISLRDGTSLAVQDGFEDLTGLDIEATLEEVKKAKEARAKAAEEKKEAA
jgi:hypothetical protein